MLTTFWFLKKFIFQKFLKLNVMNKHVFKRENSKKEKKNKSIDKGVLKLKPKSAKCKIKIKKKL